MPQFAAAWAIGTAFLLLTCARLKRVKVDGATLVISNYRRDITVPVREIRVSFRLFSEDKIVTRLRSLAGNRSEH